MEPVQIGRDDLDAWAVVPSYQVPQWSPSRSDGMTTPDQLAALSAIAAAMEPVQIGRDDSPADSP